MMGRITLVGTAVVALLIGGLLALGVHPADLRTMPWPLAALLALHGAAIVFLLWKFEIQPRLNGFRFNPTQDPGALACTLKDVPKFYDTAAPEFAWVVQVEQNAGVILAEIRALLAGPRSDFRLAYDNKILALSPTWRTLNVVSYGTVNSPLLPKTVEILSQIPHFFTCNLSRMAPRSALKSHAGESTCYIRCHFGVVIPAPAPITALEVGGEQRSWEEGKVTAFCDAHWHGAVNGSDAERYVLIFDVMPARLGWYTEQFCALMVALSVTQYVLPGRLNLDEPLWHPRVLAGYVLLSTAGIPMITGFYLYFRYFCRTRPKWLRRLADAGFGFYF